MYAEYIKLGVFVFFGVNYGPAPVEFQFERCSGFELPALRVRQYTEAFLNEPLLD